jgi:hypothetical protein
MLYDEKKKKKKKKKSSRSAMSSLAILHGSSVTFQCYRFAVAPYIVLRSIATLQSAIIAQSLRTFRSAPCAPRCVTVLTSYHSVGRVKFPCGRGVLHGITSGRDSYARL